LTEFVPSWDTKVELFLGDEVLTADVYSHPIRSLFNIAVEIIYLHS